MRLINVYELKQLLLEERAQVSEGRFGDAVRCGIRTALRCMEKCAPVDVVYCKDCNTVRLVIVSIRVITGFCLLPILLIFVVME